MSSFRAALLHFGHGLWRVDVVDGVAHVLKVA